MGISAVIDSNGRVLAPSGQFSYRHDDINFWNVNPEKTIDLPVSEWSNFKKTQGVLTTAIPIDHRVSLYSLWGDWFALTCCGLLAVGMVYALVPPKKE
jgi:apolipoprotein N-acyltransferase